MATSPNKLSQFWQELKRRKVIRVITVYAAAAFVILQLVEILQPSLSLPEWTMNFILVLLIVGFIIAVILSWIYDVHPEGGIVKTESVDDVKEVDIPKSTNSWKVASYISFVVIVVLIMINIIPRSNHRKILEKSITVLPYLDNSIAVLPFINDSPDDENVHIINGTMEAILDNLCKIEDLRVVSRTSVEQYRNNPKPITVIGKEMNVSYILEGSGQKYGDNIRLTFQLLDARNDEHLWSSPYSREIDMAEIFDLQSDIAKLVAAEIEAIITPEEEKLIEKKPTTSLTAWDLYLLGKQYGIERTEKKLLKAIGFYESAIESDPGFALAYVGIADSYMDLFWYANWLPQEAYGKAKEATLKAMELDMDLAEAHRALASIKRNFDWDLKGAEREFRRALDLNPNLATAHMGLAYLNNISGNYKEGHTYAKKALDLNPTDSRIDIYYGFTYSLIGQTDSAINYIERKGEIYPNSLSLNYLLGYLYIITEEYDKAIQVLEKAVSLDSISQPYRYYLGIAYARAGKLDETRKHLQAFKAIENEYRTVSFGKAVLFAELGEVDSSLYWLQRAYEEKYRYFLYLRSYTVLLEPIRTEPGFLEIYHKVWPNNDP